MTQIDTTNGDTGVAVDSGHIFWDNQDTGTVTEDTLTGGVTTLAANQNQPWLMAVSG